MRRPHLGTKTVKEAVEGMFGGAAERVDGRGRERRGRERTGDAGNGRERDGWSVSVARA